MEAAAGTKITITWKDLGQVKGQQALDAATIVIYDTVQKVHAVYNGPVRSDYEAEITLPESFTGDAIHGYMFFTSVADAKNSETTYLGTVIAIA